MSTSFADFLVSLRKQNGHPSARSFYILAASKQQLDFNYSYYMRIESGKALPSAAIVNSLTSLFPKEHAEQLVTKYCSELFPGHRKLFKVPPMTVTPPSIWGSKRERNQTILNTRQIASLARSSLHYHLFLLLTLARTPLPLAQIKKIFSGENLQQALRDLASAKIIAVSGESVKAMSTEFKFPLAETVELKSFYQKFDAWDRSLPQGSTLTERRKKFILRRTSARFIDLIDGLLGHLDQTIKASDENDASLNDEVFVFEYRLCTGRWPG